MNTRSDRPAADGQEVVEPGVHLAERRQRQPGVLGQVAPAAGRHDLSSSALQSRSRPCSMGRSTVRVQPGIGKDSGAGVPGTEPLEHVEAGQVAGGDDHLHAPPERLGLVEGHDELVLQEAVRTVDPVPLGHDVQRVEELW